MLSVSLLGEFNIRCDGAPVAGVDTPRLESLLAYLLLHREAPLSRAHLAFLFWPDTTEAQARTNLRNLLHSLRRALPEADRYLEVNTHTLQWRASAPFALDVDDLHAALACADRASGEGDGAALRAALERAVALYPGDLLPGFYDDWLIPLREGLRQAALGALDRLACLLEEQREYQAAIGYAQGLLYHDPLRETTYRRLIRLHALNGDRASALRVYHTCATVLQRELGVEPGAATREAYAQLLGAESGALATRPATSAFPPLVGREPEWALLLNAWRDAAGSGGPRVVLLRGEAGIGKTRLIEELLPWATRQGIATASAHCYAAEGKLAFAPVAAWLRARPLAPLEDVWLAELARLLPEVWAQRPDLPRPTALTEAWQRERFFEALARATLAMPRPLLLTIDDLQWCDRDTLEWLHFLLRFDARARLLVVGAYRPEEVTEEHPLLAALQALRAAAQLSEIELGPLDEPATRTLAERVAGSALGPEVARRLYEETEGNPLFLVERVRAGPSGAAPGPYASALAGDLDLPPRVLAVLEARLAQLSPPARELAGLAATIGREFDLRLLASASSGDDEATVCQLDELWQRRIVHERGADSYYFTHEKLREVAYHGLSAARRRLLHRRTARALAALYAANLDPVSRQLAAHYERAGEPERAALYYLRAAVVARRVFAHQEAADLLRRGLALVSDDSPAEAGVGARAVAVQLWEELGDLHELAARHEEALQAYGSAQTRADRTQRVQQARLQRKAAAVLREQRLYDATLAACWRAETTLGQRPEGDAAPWWAEWLEVQVERVWAHYWLAQWPEMEALVSRAGPVVQARGGAASRSRFLTASCLLAMRRDRYAVSDEMLATAREALSASREWGDVRVLSECHFELGFLHLWRRDLDPAEQGLQAALGLAETGGIAWIRTIALTYLAVLRRFRGQVDEATGYARRAEAAAVAANMPDYVAAARANEAWRAWRRRDLPDAERLGREALAQWQQSPLVYPFQSLARWPLIGAALALGRLDDAWAHTRALLEAPQQRLPDALHAPLTTALAAQAAGQPALARAHLDRAAAVAREMGYL